MNKKIISVSIFVVLLLAGFSITKTLFAGIGERKIRLIKDIDLPKDNAFYVHAVGSYEPEVAGIIKKGSMGHQIMKKGSTVYITFSVPISADCVEYIQ